MLTLLYLLLEQIRKIDIITIKALTFNFRNRLIGAFKSAQVFVQDVQSCHGTLNVFVL
jgi:hypothetical protein